MQKRGASVAPFRAVVLTCCSIPHVVSCLYLARFLFCWAITRAGVLSRVWRCHSVTVSKDGLDAILRLSGGDMRRVLNILQVTWL